jgi:type II secretory pathway component GspD/PulD (secretin)
MFTHFRRAAILLGLTVGLSTCKAQDATGYALPDIFVSSPKLIQRVYQVADLVVPIHDSKEQLGKPFQETLTKLLQNTVEPETWEGRGGHGTIEYYPLGMAIVVNQTEAVQKEITDLLAGLRKAQDVEVAVEVRVLHVPFECAREIDALPLPAMSDETKVQMLDETQVKKVLATIQKETRANIVQAPKMTLFNGQDAHMDCVQTQHFETGADIHWNGEKIVSTPHHESFETGFRMNLQPVVVPDQKGIRLHFQAKLASLVDESKSAMMQTTVAAEGKETAAENHAIQTPKLTTIKVDRVLSIAEGGTAMLSGWTQKVKVPNECPLGHSIPYLKRLFAKNSHEETEYLVILVTPRVITPEPDPTWSTPVFQSKDAEKARVSPPPPVVSEGQEAIAEPEEEQSKVHQWFDFFHEMMDEAEAIIEMFECWGNKLTLGAPSERMESLLISHDTSGPILPLRPEELKRWQKEGPPHLTFDRIKGGIE